MPFASASPKYTETLMNDKISLAGDLGSGKSTVASILIEKLGAEYYSTGAIVRSIAARRGMSVVELNIYMETHPEIDHEIDDGLVALSELDKPLIIDSRMAWHFTKGTFKVYLSTDAEVSAARIMGANRVGEHEASLEDTVKQTKARRESEKKRYLEQYGVNIKDLSNYSLVVDTTYATPDEVAECILNAFEAWKSNKTYKMTYISPERLNFTDDEVDGDEISSLSQKLESGENVPMPCVFECDGEFYIKENAASALAYSLAMYTYIPAKLVSGDTNGKKFVKMKSSL